MLCFRGQTIQCNVLRLATLCAYFWSWLVQLSFPLPPIHHCHRCQKPHIHSQYHLHSEGLHFFVWFLCCYFFLLFSRFLYSWFCSGFSCWWSSALFCATLSFFLFFFIKVLVRQIFTVRYFCHFFTGNFKSKDLCRNTWESIKTHFETNSHLVTYQINGSTWDLRVKFLYIFTILYLK